MIYGFLTSKEDEGSLKKNLRKVHPDIGLRSVWRYSTPKRSGGVVCENTDRTHNRLRTPKVVLRSDGEKASKALLGQVTVRLNEAGVTVVPDQTPHGDSQAGGLQESAVKTIKDNTRMIWLQFCEMHKLSAETGNHKHNLLPWADTKVDGEMFPGSY